MPDTATDDALVAQLRAWADDLATQVPATDVAAATARASAAPHSGRRRRVPARPLLVAAVVLAAIVAGVVLVGRDDGRDAGVVDAGPPAAAPDLPLVGTVWQVESAARGGQPLAIPRDGAPRRIAAFRIGAQGRVGLYDGCNWGGGTAVVAGGTVAVEGGPSTLMACGGPRGDLAQAIGDVLQGTSRWDVDRDLLTLTREGPAEPVVVRFRAPVGGFVAAPGAVLHRDEGPPAWRVRWTDAGPSQTGGMVQLAVDDTTDIEPAEGLLVLPGDPEQPIRADVVGIGEERVGSDELVTDTSVLVGVVGADAVEVEYVADGARLTIPTHAVAGIPEGRVLWAQVDPPEAGWSLRARAADGSEVAVLDVPA